MPDFVGPECGATIRNTDISNYQSFELVTVGASSFTEPAHDSSEVLASVLGNAAVASLVHEAQHLGAVRRVPL